MKHWLTLRNEFGKQLGKLTMTFDSTPIPAVRRAMVGFRAPWHVVGGWAVDLHLRRITRQHHDIEVAIFRDDQLELIRHFDGQAEITWQQAGSWYAWDPGHLLVHPLHQIRLCTTQGLEFDVLLNDREGDEWIYRRDRRVRRSLTHFSMGAGDPYPAEILLLYKARDTRPQDRMDHCLLSPQLTPEQSAWLRQALDIAHPTSSW